MARTDEGHDRAETTNRPRSYLAGLSLFGANVYVSLGMIALVCVGIAAALVIFFAEGTPSSFTIASGPAGSSFDRYAEQYQKILARQGITLKIVHSDGSFDNLHKLNDPKSGVDVAFVQGGDAGTTEVEHLSSLGSISYQPLLVFYRGKP